MADFRQQPLSDPFTIIWGEHRLDLAEICFADDTTMITLSIGVADLTRLLDQMVTVMARYGLRLNWGKTKYMLLLHGKLPPDVPDLGYTSCRAASSAWASMGAALLLGPGGPAAAARCCDPAC